jgi:23S rRNA (cytosine1962-C5)-methyltransferase
MTGARVTPRGAERWVRGHPWIYRSDVLDGPDAPGLVEVRDQRGRFLGQALYSPRSEIRLRLLERSSTPVDSAWWRERLHASAALRQGIDATAYRLVFGEGDALPSLIVDRYDRWLVVQILSAGLETMRETILSALKDIVQPEGILLRNDSPVRTREGLPTDPIASGSVPNEIEVREGPVRYLAAPWEGQKTGAFLDQRPNRVLAGALMADGGRALDCFTYHGSFAIHLARRAASVLALDASAEALDRGAVNARLNGLSNITWNVADVFESLRAFERSRERFDLIVLDPPAFAKSRASVPAALRGYREINLRAMRLLSPGGGILLTASCSFHVRLPQFLSMLSEAAGDSGRRIVIDRILGQGEDHPEVLTIPETGYLKGAVLRAV